uniref:Uncharacterized protein n=1 Tax=Setaria viridis TaxID=4556 RepID=A0A4U6VJE2_SETVI|nr:hypothetical protein SEVIR_3G368050v2 [Setaria viridis]
MGHLGRLGCHKAEADPQARSVVRPTQLTGWWATTSQAQAGPGHLAISVLQDSP